MTHTLTRMIVGWFALMFFCACGSDDGGSNVAGDTDTDNEASENVEQQLFPDCGTGSYTGKYLLAGPGEDGYDAELARKARQYDRQFHTFVAYPMGVNCDVSVSLESTEKREWIERFLSEDDGWDFETFSGGLTPTDAVDSYHKVAGLYGGAGIAADAMRYAVLRDQGADCDEIDVARSHLTRSLEALHLAHDIADVPGVVVRGFIRTDIPGYGSTTETTPLTDEKGVPLPYEKDNGTWRDDPSGRYPNYIMEDSCSRDMILGWAMASAVAKEVMQNDPSFDDSLKERLASDAHAVVEMLRTVRESGYDLEFLDVDGRITYHGYINEHCVERELYVENGLNGFHAIMALGIVGAYAYASGDASDAEYIYNELIGQRKLPEAARDDMMYINMGTQSNFSNYNMAFVSAWLAQRYLDNETARQIVAETTNVQLYDTPDESYQPKGAQMALYDFILLSTTLDDHAFGDPDGTIDEEALQDGLASLYGFAEPPYWDYAVEQCDEQELQSGDCSFEDGTQTVVLFEGGRKGSTICEDPIPKAIRRPSNFEWRSNPYNPNGGGGGSSLLPGVDFRVAYWMGRFTRVP